MSEVSEGFLLRRAQAGDSRAAGALIDRHKGLLARVARELFAPGLTFDDLFQEARVGALKAIRDYDADRADATSFVSFMRLCATRQVLTAVVFARRRKFEHLNRCVPLDAPIGLDEQCLADELPDRTPDIPDTLALREDLHRLAVMARFELSEFERVALAGKLNGNSYRDIADLTGASAKRVDNALQRVRRKATSALAA